MKPAKNESGSITGRKKLEQIAKEAREYAESVVETVREPLIVLDADLRIISSNKSFYRGFKVNPEETQGRLIYDLGNRQWNIPTLRKLLEEILPNNTSFENYEVEHDFPHIGRRIMLLNARRIPRPPAKPRIILLAIEDITGRKRLENELLQAKEEESRAIFDNAADGILLADMKSKKFIRGNNAICRMLGYSMEEIKVLGVTDIHPKKDIPYVIDQFERQTKGEFSLSRNLPVKRKDGSVFYADVNATTINIGKKTYLAGFFHDITERKKAEEKIAESEAKYRFLVENMHEMSIILNKTGTILFANRSALETMGYKEDEIVGKSIAGFLTKGSLKKALWALAQEFLGKHHGEFEIYVKNKKGEIRTWQIIGLANPVRKDGKMVGLLICAHDITERKKAEDELKISEERFRLAVNATKDGIWEWSIQTNQEFFSHRWCEIIGYSFDDPELPHTYKSWESRIHPDDHDSVVSALNNHLKNGTKYDVEYRHLHKSGEYRWQNSKGQAVFDESGKLIKMVGCISDITERKKMEEKVKLFSDAVASAFDYFFIADLRGNITYANESASKAFGYTHGELLKLNIAALDADKNAAKEIMQKVQVEGKWSGEVVNVKKNKEELTCFLSVFIIKDENGNPKGAMGILRDITERKKADEELKKSREAMQIKVDELEKFLKLTVGRELKMVELKKTIKDMEDREKK